MASRIRVKSSLLVLRIAGEGYIVVGSSARDLVLEQLTRKWNRILKEARQGSMGRAMGLYSELFEWLDQLGSRVPRYWGGADIVLPPRDLNADELKSLLGDYKR